MVRSRCGSSGCFTRGAARSRASFVNRSRGATGWRLERLLHARGDEIAGIIRKPEQGDDLLAARAGPVVCDLESASVADVARHLEGADAGVFAAGAGPGSGEARKDTVDRAACDLFADAADAAGG